MYFLQRCWCFSWKQTAVLSSVRTIICFSLPYSGRLGTFMLGSKNLIQIIKIYFNRAFELTILGYFLGLEIYYASGFLYTKTYFLSLLLTTLHMRDDIVIIFDCIYLLVS